MEPETDLKALRQKPTPSLFREYWRGPVRKNLDTYPGSELYKKHMKGVIDGIIRYDNEM